VLKAPLVIGAVHPKVVLDMLPDGAVKPSYRKRISNLRNTYGIFCVHAELDAAYHEEIPYNIFKVDTDKYGNIPDIKFYQIRKSEKSEKNLLSILHQASQIFGANGKIEKQVVVARIILRKKINTPCS